MESTRAGRTRRTAVAATLLAFVVAFPVQAASRGSARVPAAPSSRLTIDTDANADHLRAGGLASFAPTILDSSKFSFTAPGQTAARARMQTVERAFRFTPSGKVDNRRALSIGVTSRVAAVVPDTSRAAAPVEVAAAVAPAAYNVDLAVGWRGFGVSGGYSRSETLGGVLPTSLTPRREAVDVAVSYRGKSWKTSLQLAAENGAPTILTPMLVPDRRYSVELGGAYLLTPKLSVNGGVRYKTTPNQVEPLRDDQSVYLGTAFTF